LPLSKLLSISLADLLQDFSSALIGGNKLLGLGVKFLGYIVHLRAQTGIAYGQVVLGAVTAALGAFAAGLATALVAFDKRTAEDGDQRRKFAPQGLAPPFQGMRGLFCHNCRTTLKTGLIIFRGNSLCKLFLGCRGELF